MRVMSNFIYFIKVYILIDFKTAEKYHAWSCKNVYDALTILLDIILYNLALSCINK